MSVKPKITVWCDGGCRGNGKETNLGAWAAILNFQGKEKEIYGVVENTTNNIMELTACIEALKIIKNKDVEVQVVTDSQYLSSGISSWIYKWMSNGWVNSKNEPVKNIELWQELYSQVVAFHALTFQKVRGHENCEGNNRVDALLNKAMDAHYQLVYGV